MEYHTNIRDLRPKHGRIDSVWKVESGHEYIGVILKATNTSDEDVYIYSSDFKLINSNGEELSPCVPMVKIWDKYDYLAGTKLVKGGTKTGIIIFNNPNTNNSNLVFKMEKFHWFSDNEIHEIRLKK